MNLKDGIDFSRDDVAEALLRFAAQEGADISEDPSDVIVIKTGSKLRREGVFLTLKRKEASDGL